jgi:hypothetical protein
MRSAVACVMEVVKWTRPSLCLCLAVALVLLAGHARPVSADSVDYCTFPVITYAIGEPAQQLRAFGTDYLVTLGGSTLSVLSLADPSVPSLLARVEVLDQGWVDLAIGGSIAYCLDYSGTVHAVSLADPAAPAVLGVPELGGPISGLGAEGNLLGVVAPDSTWSLFDVTDPLAPTLLYQATFYFAINDVDVGGGLAIVRGGGWRAYDLSRPSRPMPIGEDVFGHMQTWGTEVLASASRGRTLVLFMNQWSIFDMGEWGDFCANGLSLLAIDVAIPGNPQQIASADLGAYYDYGYFHGANLTLVDGLVFASHGDVGLYDLDAGLTPRAAIAAGGTVGAMAAGADHVYVTVADGNGTRLATYAIRDPFVDNTWPVPLQYYSPFSEWIGGATAGSGWFAIWSQHLGEWSDRPTDLDIYDAAQVHVRRFELEDGVFGDVDESGRGFFMVCSSDPTVSWVDMADPEHPGNPQAVPITGVFSLGVGPDGLVAAVCGDSWLPELLRIYDLTNHESPILLSTLDLGPYALLGDPLWLGHLVLVPSTFGLQVVDVQDPTAPVVRSWIALEAAWVRPAGGTRALAGSDRGVYVIDLADPAAPVLVSSMDDLSGITDAKMMDGTVYVANGGVNALDSSTLMPLGLLAPEHPIKLLLDLGGTLLGVVDRTTGRFVELPVHGGAVSVEQGPSDPPRTSVARLSTSPNPFNPRTTASFTLPAAGHATLAIYDARGCEVARLVDESVSAGPHGIEWSGLTASGQTVPSGTYFWRLTTPWGEETRKVQLVR